LSDKSSVAKIEEDVNKDFDFFQNAIIQFACKKSRNMKYKLIAEVESALFISENVSVSHQDIRVEFLKNSHGKLTQISVSKSVPTDKLDNFKQIFETAIGSAEFKISIGADKKLHNELVT